MSEREKRRSPRLLAVAGSMRSGSFNRKLLRIGVQAAEKEGAEVDLVDLRELNLPLYDGDLEAREGLPEGAVRFKERIGRADGLLIASPEYNTSVPGTFKNAIDWASRGPDDVFENKIAALMGASPGGFGAVRSLLHLRQILTGLGVWLIPSQVTLSRAHQAFDPEGALKDPEKQNEIAQLVNLLIRQCRLQKERAGGA
jgi:chromate reductase